MLCTQSRHEICWSYSCCRQEVLSENQPVGRRSVSTITPCSSGLVDVFGATLELNIPPNIFPLLTWHTAKILTWTSSINKKRRKGKIHERMFLNTVEVSENKTKKKTPANDGRSPPSSPGQALWKAHLLPLTPSLVAAPLLAKTHTLSLSAHGVVRN